MRRLRALRLFAFGMTVILAVLGAETVQAVAEGFLVPKEQAMHARVNAARADRNLAALPNHDALRWMSRRHSQTMAARSYIFHTDDLRAAGDAAELPWVRLGENVGRGPDADLISDAFEASPSHYRNIVHPEYNALGIGGVANPVTLFFTQTYATLRAPAPAPAAASPPPPPVLPEPEATAAPTPAPTAPPAEPTAPPVVAADGAVLAADAGVPEPLPRPNLVEVLLALLRRAFANITFWR